jgi:hypothetical protein
MARAYHDHSWEAPEEFNWHYESEASTAEGEVASND